jgi:APA family basic amino acid/polyamine antiporter
MYVPIIIAWMIKEKELGFVKRFVLPIASIVACLFMVFAAVYAHGITPFLAAKAEGKFSFPVLFYIIVYAVIMLAGALVRKSKVKTEE